MKRKILKVLGLVLIASFLLVVLWEILSSNKTAPEQSADEVSAAGSANAGLAERVTLPLVSRERMRDAERRKYLEALGSLPEDADLKDAQLAQHASWWGKRPDPEDFWKGRPIWLDRSAKQQAHRYGRAFPPIPIDDPRFRHFENEKDFDTSRMWDVEGPNIMYRFTERESAFWRNFSKEHPQPPEEIEAEQLRLANEILQVRARIAKGDTRLGSKQSNLEIDQRRIDTARELGFPPEAFTDVALVAAYAVEKRKEFEALSTGPRATSSFIWSRWFDHLAVDRKLVTETPASVLDEMGRKWKIAYLQRLRKEKVDKTYDDAYSKAWNLSPIETLEASVGH